MEQADRCSFARVTTKAVPCIAEIYKKKYSHMRTFSVLKIVVQTLKVSKRYERVLSKRRQRDVLI